MPLLIDESFLPATLTAPPMTDEQFAQFCADHSDYFIEMTADGELLIMPPNFSLTGMRNGKISAQLENWASKDQRGAVTDASGGFVLPNGARRSPDAAWTLKQRVLALPPASLNGFWPLCPEFIIELRSQTDRLPVLRAKMHEWIANGTQLAWLIDPERRAVEVYRPEQNVQMLEQVLELNGEGPIQGFTLDLRPVWDPLSLQP